MRPIEFPGSNVTYAKDQAQYLPLPALRFEDEHVTVVSCWKLTFWERVKILFTGKLWLSQLSFGDPLQPQKPTIDRPFVYTEDAESLFDRTPGSSND